MSARIAADGVLSFRTQEDFRKWLEANHRQSQGLWLRIFKKDSGKSSINYSEALEEALCFGWIDGQKQRQDELSWLQRFTPRRRKSGWSRINTEDASRLMEAGRMTAAGLTEIDAAKRDGRWRVAYDSPSRATFPKEFLAALGQNKKAKEFFDSLNKANRYAIAYRLQTAKKPETRQRRMQLILAMLARREAFH